MSKNSRIELGAREEKGKLKTICSWCKKELGEIEADNISGDEISHGVCSECHKKLNSGEIK